MASSISIPARQRAFIVIDDIIFVKRKGNTLPERHNVSSGGVIDDIIFVKMEKSQTISFAAITRDTSGFTVRVEEPPFARSGSLDKLIVFDPNECLIEIDTSVITIYGRQKDDGVGRISIKKYKLEDLDYMTVETDGPSGKPVFKFYLK